MESFYSLMLVALQQRIEDKVPEIRYIDQDFGQLDFYKDRPAVALPCLLVDFTNTTYDTLSQQEQLGKVMIQCRLGFQPFSNSNNLTPSQFKEKALAYYELERKVFLALQNWAPDEMCQPLVRLNEGSEKREDPLRVRIMMFDTTFQDDGARPVTEKIEAPLQFEFD